MNKLEISQALLIASEKKYETIEIVTTEGSQVIAISDAELCFPFGGFEKNSIW